MEFKNEKLQLIKSAIMYAIMYAKTEAETAEFSLMLVDIEVGIAEDEQTEERIEKLKSLQGCVWKYCAYSPKCEGKCIHV